MFDVLGAAQHFSELSREGQSLGKRFPQDTFSIFFDLDFDSLFKCVKNFPKNSFAVLSREAQFAGIEVIQSQ